jgi:hypothetical protein
LSDTRTLYDVGAFGAVPTKGLVTETQALATAGGSDYVTKSKAGHDAYGRATSGTDALKNTTKTAYTQLTITGQTYTGGVTKVTTTHPKGFVATTDVNPAWGTPVTETDINGQATSMEYGSWRGDRMAWVPAPVASASSGLLAGQLDRRGRLGRRTPAVGGRGARPAMPPRSA